MMGASNIITFPDNPKIVKQKKTETLIKQFYSQISEGEFVRLEKIYEKDFELFEYHKPTYSEVIGN